MNFCVIDFETTGLSPALDEVIEYAAVQVRGGELGLNLASLCRPHRAISRRITEITGINQRMVAGHQPFESALPLLLSFMGDATLVAHNVPFDLGFLNRYCREKGLHFTPKTFCTLEASRKLYPKLEHHNLASVAAHLNIENPQAHRALADALTTARILIRMMEQTTGVLAGQQALDA